MSAPALPTIGTKFLYRRTKHTGFVAHTVEDIWTMTNAIGKVVRIEYRCSHEFMGCKLTAGFLTVQIQKAIADHGEQG